jgi:hypothetical protein
MSLEINYIDAPDGAQEKMTAIGEGGNALSDPTLIATGGPNIPYATLEPGVWKLDGTMRILPDDPHPGWWSLERSGGDGAFANPPRITISFPEPYGSTGFTMTFSPATDQWCSEIHATWYNGQTLLVDQTYYPTGPNWILEETVESFDTVVFDMIRTNKPGHFAKVQKIEIGRTVLFGADEIIRARLLNEVDSSLCELTVDTMEFEIHDPKERSFLPQETQRVELLQNGVLRASHYITSSTRKAKSNYSIQCQSSIGLLNDEFLGGMYSQKPLPELVAEILGEWEFEIHPYFDGATLTGYIPVCSQREALQQVSFAVGALISTQDSTKIRFLPIPKTVSTRFNEAEILRGGSVKTAPRYARVEVNSHTYTKTDNVETLMDEEEVEGENVLITFTTPHYDYEITGGVINASGINWVNITPNGLVTLNAKTYLHSTRTHVKRNPEATAREKGNYIAVTECTLINSGNAQEAVERLYAAKQQRQTVNQDVIVKGQKAGQVASSLTPWGTITRGFISSMDSTLTQTGHVAAIQIQGIEVTLESVWLYSGEIYSGGQEVLY